MQNVGLFNWFFSCALIVCGYFTAKFIANYVSIFLNKLFIKQYKTLFKKFAFYLIFLLFIALALQQVGIDITILLGTAGFLTIAIGFASKTVISNFISGLFIIVEGAVEIGDKIQVGKYKGKLASIDLLSVKIKTSSQQYIRIPNETILKAELANLSKSDVVKQTLNIELNISSETTRFLEDLSLVVGNCVLAMSSPAPEFLITEIKSSILIIQCKIWCKTEDMDKMVSDILLEVQKLYQKDNRILPLKGHLVRLQQD